MPKKKQEILCPYCKRRLFDMGVNEAFIEQKCACKQVVTIALDGKIKPVAQLQPRAEKGDTANDPKCAVMN